MTIIVVEGIGDIVSKPTGYARALHKLRIDRESEGRSNELRIVFTDICDEWHKASDPELLQERQKTKADLLKWGAEFLDKSESSPDRQAYEDLLHQSVDAVFVATPDKHHIKVARHWLSGNCKRVFIEKPLTNDPEEARQWLDELESNEHDRERLTQLDHYLLKIHAQVRYEKHLRQMLKSVGKLTHLRFYMLEDHSGTDERYRRELNRRGRSDRNGPIENEGRTDTLQSGVSLDLLPHLWAILHYLGFRTIELEELRAAKYVGVDYDDNRPAGIVGETFAALKFSFMNRLGKIAGEAYVGKGIHSAAQYESMVGNVKVLELQGGWGTIEFDFNKNMASSIVKDEVEPLVGLESDPYYYLIKEVANEGLTRGTDLGMPVRTGAAIQKKIASEITSRTISVELPTYALGNRLERLPPTLEDLLEGGKNEIPPLILSS